MIRAKMVVCRQIFCLSHLGRANVHVLIALSAIKMGYVNLISISQMKVTTTFAVLLRLFHPYQKVSEDGKLM